MLTVEMTRRNDLENEIQFQTLKNGLHEQLIESLDLATVVRTDSEHVRAQIREIAGGLMPANLLPDIRRRLKEEIEDEVFGLGPLQPLLSDSVVSDVLVNGPHDVKVERHGRLEDTAVVFADDSHLRRVIHRIVSRVGRRIDEVSPMVDARLADGSRINAVVSPLALNGPLLSIRKFQRNRLDLPELTACNTLSKPMAEFLSGAVQARVSLLISGGTGAGKTTLLNALSEAIPQNERIITIEDSAELQLRHTHVARLETRPANSEGAGECTQRDLVKNSLRMRPDRIIVGEVRGAEALDMLQAMNTGHEGSMTTIHANDAPDALTRLEMMVAMTGADFPVSVVRQYISCGIRLIVQLARLKGGVRRIVRISELTKPEDEHIRVVDVFRFRQFGLDKSGAARGRFVATGHMPQLCERFADYGVPFDRAWFQTSEQET